MQMIANERLLSIVLANDETEMKKKKKKGKRKKEGWLKFFRLPIGFVRSRTRGQMNLAFRLGASREVLCMHCGRSAQSLIKVSATRDINSIENIKSILINTGKFCAVYLKK